MRPAYGVPAGAQTGYVCSAPRTRTIALGNAFCSVSTQMMSRPML
jgi:hypothetical protein